MLSDNPDKAEVVTDPVPPLPIYFAPPGEVVDLPPLAPNQIRLQNSGVVNTYPLGTKFPQRDPVLDQAAILSSQPHVIT